MHVMDLLVRCLLPVVLVVLQRSATRPHRRVAVLVVVHNPLVERSLARACGGRLMCATTAVHAVLLLHWVLLLLLTVRF